MSSTLENPWDNKKVDGETAKKMLQDRVLQLTLPPHNLNRIQLSQMINRSVSTVHRVQRELLELGLLQATENGHLIKAAQPKLLKSFLDISKTDFLNIPSVKRWKDMMERNNVINIPYNIANFWKVCQTIDVHPDAFLLDIEEVEAIAEKFKLAFKEGKAVYIKKKHQDDPLKQSQADPQHYIESIRSFIKGNSKEIPEGFLIVKRKQNKIYAQIRLSDKERIEGIRFMQKFGEDLRILFTLHNEMGVRSDTLFTMRPKFELHRRTFDGINCEWYKAFIYEKKQSTPYEKYILSPNAKLTVSKLTPGKLVHTYTNIKKGKDEYNQKLRELFAYFKKISPNPMEQNQYEKGTQEYYLVNDPTHAIRHSCVHWLMRITGNRTEEVASLFWEQSDTLKIYARQSFEDMLEDDTCALCNPDPNENNYKRFCTLKHSIIYYNTNEEQRNQLRMKKKWGELIAS